MLDNESFQRQDIDGAYKRLNISSEEPRFNTLTPDTRLMPHQVVAVDWMVEMEDSTAGGGLLADDCGVGKVNTLGPRCWRHAIR